jgi:uncharacterized protein (TIGR03437 family)
VLDETLGEVIFASGPPVTSNRYGELGAVFGIDLTSAQIDKVQFQRHLSEIDNTDLGSSLAPVPGGVITVEASNIRSKTFVQANNTPLPELLATASLYVNGKRVPIFSVGPWELTAQLPWGTTAGDTAFQIKFADGETTQVLHQVVAPISPWLEGFAANNNFGCEAAAYHAGTTQLADQAHPAMIGEAIDLITSGLGPTTPVAADGVPTPASPAYPITNSLGVYLSSILSEVKFAQLDAGTFGKYRVRVVVPAVTYPEVQVSMEMGGTLNSNSCIFFVSVP